MNSLLLLTIVFLSIYKSSIVESKIRCMTGYGQRGLLYSDATLWEHTCPLSDYCFEIYTTDLAVVQELIRFPWVSKRYISLFVLVIVRYCYHYANIYFINMTVEFILLRILY